VRTDADDMLKRRLKQAGLPTHYSPHSFRATGITNFLENAILSQAATKSQIASFTQSAFGAKSQCGFIGRSLQHMLFCCSRKLTRFDFPEMITNYRLALGFVLAHKS
jgi:hypothetical protein